MALVAVGRNTYHIVPGLLNRMPCRLWNEPARGADFVSVLVSVYCYAVFLHSIKISSWRLPPKRQRSGGLPCMFLES